MTAKKFTLLLIILLSSTIVFSQVGIGIASPDASAMLDVTSTTKGFLPPRMDEAARDLISATAGLLIYNTNTNQLNYYNGSAWQIVDTSTGFVNLTTDQTNIAGNKTFTGTLTPAGRLMIPMGELNYYNYNSTPLSVNTGTASTGASGNDNMVAVNPQPGNTVNFVNDMFTLDGSGSPVVSTPSNSRLEYTSGDAVNPFVGRYFHIALSFSFSSVTGNTGKTFVFGVSHKDLSELTDGVVNSSKQFVTVGSADTHQSSALHVLLWLDDGDEIGFSIGQLGGSGNVLIKSFNFVAIGM